MCSHSDQTGDMLPKASGLTVAESQEVDLPTTRYDLLRKLVIDEKMYTIKVVTRFCRSSTVLVFVQLCGVCTAAAAGKAEEAESKTTIGCLLLFCLKRG